MVAPLGGGRRWLDRGDSQRDKREAEMCCVHEQEESQAVSDIVMRRERRVGKIRIKRESVEFLDRDKGEEARQKATGHGYQPGVNQGSLPQPGSGQDRVP